jgi:hypothetical protein
MIHNVENESCNCESNSWAQLSNEIRHVHYLSRFIYPYMIDYNTDIEHLIGWIWLTNFDVDAYRFMIVQIKIKNPLSTRFYSTLRQHTYQIMFNIYVCSKMIWHLFCDWFCLLILDCCTSTSSCPPSVCSSSCSSSSSSSVSCPSEPEKVSKKFRPNFNLRVVQDTNNSSIEQDAVESQADALLKAKRMRKALRQSLPEHGLKQ